MTVSLPKTAAPAAPATKVEKVVAGAPVPAAAKPPKAPKAKAEKAPKPLPTNVKPPVEKFPKPPKEPKVETPKVETISKGAFKKSSFLVAKATIKSDKINFKPGLFKRVQLFIVASVLRLMSTVNLMRAELTPVLAGNQITPENRKNAQEMLGFTLQYLMVIARALKVKIPSLARGKLGASSFDAFMALDRAVGRIYGVIAGTLDGNSLTNEDILNLLREQTTIALNSVVILCKVLAQKSAAEIVTEHDKFLRTNNAAAFAPTPELTEEQKKAKADALAAKLAAMSPEDRAKYDAAQKARSDARIAAQAAKAKAKAEKEAARAAEVPAETPAAEGAKQ